MAGAPRGPRQGPTANLSPCMNSMDRNMLQNLQSLTPAALRSAVSIPDCEHLPVCRQAQSWNTQSPLAGLIAAACGIARIWAALALTWLIFAAHTAWCS